MKKKAWKYETANFLGILFALGFAAGGLFYVQYRLEAEEREMMQGSGRVEMPAATMSSEALRSLEAEAERACLTEDQLLQVLKNLYSDGEVSFHEPRSGQLSMAEAVEYGKRWAEDFFLPNIGMEGFTLGEFRSNCHLWECLENREETMRENPIFSYWTVTIMGEELEMTVVLNAVTGQVLEADVNCFFLVEHRENGSLTELLWNYADSFGVEGTFVMSEEGKDIQETNGVAMYQRAGEQILYAYARDSSFVIAGTGESQREYTEIYNVHMGLEVRDL